MRWVDEVDEHWTEENNWKTLFFMLTLEDSIIGDVLASYAQTYALTFYALAQQVVMCASPYSRAIGSHTCVYKLIFL